MSLALRNNDYLFRIFFQFKVVEIITGLLYSPPSWCFCTLTLRTCMIQLEVRGHESLQGTKSSAGLCNAREPDLKLLRLAP